jgi:hypothetical protein
MHSELLNLVFGFFGFFVGCASLASDLGRFLGCGF